MQKSAVAESDRQIAEEQANQAQSLLQELSSRKVSVQNIILVRSLLRLSEAL